MSHTSSLNSSSRKLPSITQSAHEHFLVDKYQNLVDASKIKFDASQQQAVELLQQLYTQLHTQEPNKNRYAIKGIYLWGKVGRGKTFLMDLFVECLSSSELNGSPNKLSNGLMNAVPSQLCKRQHFHHFMRDVHQQLNALSGKPEPLKQIAKSFSQQWQILCFDEFFVSDIGDAMLLGNLLQYMFELNIVVVSTSNCAPQELYRNGLQRERFLPAIAAIEHHTQIVHLDGEHDHRFRALTYVQNYFELSESIAQQTALHQKLLSQHSLVVPQKESCITVLGREISIIAKHLEADNKTIAFDFATLCQGPRSHLDYVELAKRFNTILVFNVPPMSGQAYERIKARGTEDNGSNINVSTASTGEREVVLAPMDDAVRRFIALVDECYDCHLNLVITAFVGQTELYESGSLMFEFERTKSRLVEMASQEYLDKVYSQVK